MATPPDFTVGQVLTAAQMNAVGLWKMTPTSVTDGTINADGSVTIGATKSSVTINGCFTSDYDNYKIILSGGSVSSSNCDIRLQLRTSGGSTSTTGYYSGLIYSTLASATPVAFNNNNATLWSNFGTSLTTTTPSANADLLSPNLARRTIISNMFARPDACGFLSGYHDVATAYNSIVISPSPGTFSNCVVHIYGYN
jgi:hypothetical protein